MAIRHFLFNRSDEYRKVIAALLKRTEGGEFEKAFALLEPYRKEFAQLADEQMEHKDPEHFKFLIQLRFHALPLLENDQEIAEAQQHLLRAIDRFSLLVPGVYDFELEEIRASLLKNSPEENK